MDPATIGLFVLLGIIVTRLLSGKSAFIAVPFAVAKGISNGVVKPFKEGMNTSYHPKLEVKRPWHQVSGFTAFSIIIAALVLAAIATMILN